MQTHLPENDQAQDWLEVFDKDGKPLGLARRGECHGNPCLIHRTVHVVVVDRTGALLLQKRPHHKDTQPGKWDTAVGGHVDVGEELEEAARREMAEELGIARDLPIYFLCDRQIRNDFESENVRVYMLRYDGPFRPAPREIDALHFWSREELVQELDTGIFTPSLATEIQLILARFPDLLAPSSCDESRPV